MPEQNQPWHGTASLAKDTLNPRYSNDSTSPPVHTEPLLRHALDTTLTYSMREIAARTPNQAAPNPMHLVDQPEPHASKDPANPASTTGQVS